MQRKSFEEMHCSVAQCLEVIGEWWTPLILRDLFMGVTRFDDFQTRLGISRNILTERLNHLIAQGVVTKTRYQEHPERFDYKLTEKGRDLWQVVTAMREWGDRWAAPSGPAVQLVHRSCGNVTKLVAVCDHCGERLERRDVKLVDGPGAGTVSLLPSRS